jgi:hypothetical protein
MLDMLPLVEFLLWYQLPFFPFSEGTGVPTH